MMIEFEKPTCDKDSNKWYVASVVPNRDGYYEFLFGDMHGYGVAFAENEHLFLFDTEEDAHKAGHKHYSNNGELYPYIDEMCRIDTKNNSKVMVFD